MLIVDSQVHIWGADTPDRPWPPGGAQRAQKPTSPGCRARTASASTCSPKNCRGSRVPIFEWVMGRGVCEWLGWPLPAS
jgi:hypothetical protein